MIRKLYILPIFIYSFFSCDLLRLSPFEVLSWTPGDGYHSDAENIFLSLDFSHDPDKASVERHFSLTGNGNRIKGTFSWDGRKMIFTPLVLLEKNIEYSINLSANAHDSSGLSLDKAFYCEFTTRDNKTRPVLVSSYPEMYAQVSDPRAEIRLHFSLPVPIETLYDNVSFNPSMTGYWRLEENGNLAVFSPAEPWARHGRYEIHVSSSLTDNRKNTVNNEYSIVFTTGTDYEMPYLLYAERITKNKERIELHPDRGFTYVSEFPVENEGWEKEDKLSLIFSKPVDSLSVKNYLSAENAPGLILETLPGYMKEIIFKFDNTPVFGSRFSFRIKQGVKDSTGNETENEYIYRIFADGKYSKPPTLAGIRIPMAPDNYKTPELVCFETESLFNSIPINNNDYPSGVMKQTWIEFYFVTAEGASIDPFSLMELFRTETSNNVIVFSPRQVKTSGFSIPVQHSEWENFQRIEIAGFLTNSINFGIINFLIAPGLKDNLGNKNDKTQRISVVK
jgi:hypothetical protein